MTFSQHGPREQASRTACVSGWRGVECSTLTVNGCAPLAARTGASQASAGDTIGMRGGLGGKHCVGFEGVDCDVGPRRLVLACALLTITYL